MTSECSLADLQAAHSAIQQAAQAFFDLDPNDPDFLNRADDFAALLAQPLGHSVLGSSDL